MSTVMSYAKPILLGVVGTILGMWLFRKYFGN